MTILFSHIPPPPPPREKQTLLRAVGVVGQWEERAGKDWGSLTKRAQLTAAEALPRYSVFGVFSFSFLPKRVHFCTMFSKDVAAVLFCVPLSVSVTTEKEGVVAIFGGGSGTDFSFVSAAVNTLSSRRSSFQHGI